MPVAAYRPIRADGVGAIVGRREVRITTRMTMAYAAGIGAIDAMYLDDLRPGGVVAPLPYITALEWPVLTSTDYLTAIGRDAPSAFDGLLHAFQDTRFARPVRPGMRVLVVGQIVEIIATAAGALVVCRIRTSDQSDDALVAESWYGSLYRHTAVDGRPAALFARPVLRSAPSLLDEEANKSFVINIPREKAHVYTECAQIWNPIHTERSYAISAGLPDIILHGTCTWAMTLQGLASRTKSGPPELPFRRFGARFSRMVVPGSAISVEYSTCEEGYVSFVVRNASGDIALSYGTAEA